MNEPRLGSRFQMREKAGVAWIETDLGNHRIVFSFRSPPGAGKSAEILDVGRTIGQPGPEQTLARSRLCEAIDVDPGIVHLARQVHGTALIDMRTGPRSADTLEDSTEPRLDADGFLLPASGSGRGALIVTADCLPVVLRGRGGTALIHLGWRGLAGGLLERAVAEVSPVEAVIGPGIGPCCYEVGSDVTDALGIPESPGRTNVDLAALVAERLANSGVERIDRTSICTSCEKELLFSHRRDGEGSGRQCTMVFPR